MARRPTYLIPGHHKRRGTGFKPVRGIDGEIIIEIYLAFGMQRFTYVEAKKIIMEQIGINLPTQTLGSFVSWKWLNKVGETTARRPRLIYQVPSDMQLRINAILYGEKIARTSRQTFR